MACTYKICTSLSTAAVDNSRPLGIADPQYLENKEKPQEYGKEHGDHARSLPRGMLQSVLIHGGAATCFARPSRSPR